MNFIKSTLKNAIQHKSVTRVLNASLAMLFVTSLVLNINSNNESADAASYQTCKSPNTGKVVNLTPSMFEPASINIVGDKAVATFKFPGECAGQSIPITFASYKAPNTPDNMPFSQQVLFDHVTRNYNEPRNGAQITISVPNCKFQVDLVVGHPITQFSDGHGSANTYTGQKRMITASGGGTGDCFAQPAPAPTPAPTTAPAPTPTPAPAPAPANNTTNIDNSVDNSIDVSNSGSGNVNVGACQNGTASASVGSGAGTTSTSNCEVEVDQEVTVKKPVTQTQPPVEEEPEAKTPVKTTVAAESEVTVSEPAGKGKAEAPKELPNTGPGALLPFIFGTSFMGSFLYSARARYSEMLAKLVARF